MTTGWAGSQLKGTKITLVRPVGSGSHSTVHLATTPSRQLCAVKVFRPEMRSHAEREFEVGRRFQHPCLSRPHHLSTVNDHPALLLSWAPGETMFVRYAQRPALASEPHAFLTTIHTLLRALGHMHDSGFLHRDVKPDNIMVNKNGGAILVDYDLAGPIREPLGGGVGTPAFQSPESRLGVPLEPSSDVYGVALLLFWGWAGHLPEAGGDHSSRWLESEGDEVEDDPNFNAADLVDGVPSLGLSFEDDLRETLRRALQRDPAHRLQSATQMMRKVAEWCAAMPAPRLQVMAEADLAPNK